jgi:DNA-binding SARP family transcriptional activator/TolB-like protein/tetratricopeptide (TPR) repeat protein
MALLINLLGPLAIEHDHHRLGNLPRKARALMAYLAAQNGAAVSRERLADLLWPYQGSDQARHSLRNCLLELRKALGQSGLEHLAAEFAVVRLNGVETDLERFERLARSRHRGELTTAAELYRGELLADFIIDSEPFQDWLSAQRDRTLDLVCDVLQRLAAAQDEAAEHEAAIKTARRLTSLDPLSEIGQRALIQAYAQAGRRPEALRQYRLCADILRRELGVAPDEKTQALAREIVQAGNSSENGHSRPTEQPAGRSRVAAPVPAPIPGPVVGVANGTAPSCVQWPCLLPTVGVAVSPLRNLTGDPDQQYLMEAFTDDLVTDLVRSSRGLAMARAVEEMSRPVDIQSRFAESEIEFVITGSAQRSGPTTLRVNMQISSASTAEYCWVDRYECDVTEFGSIQTSISRQIARELHLLALHQASRRAVTTYGQFAINECLSRAAAALTGAITPETTAEAQRWFLSALAHDRRNVEALSGLAVTCQRIVSQPWWGDPHSVSALSDLGREAVAIALEMAPGHALAKCIQGMVFSTAGRLEEAQTAIEEALVLDPALGLAHGYAGYNEALRGHAELTLPAAERAMRVDRQRHSIFLFYAGFAELLLGRADSAIGLLQNSLEHDPIYGTARLFMTAALALLGREAEAARSAAAFRKQYPESRINDFEQLWLSRSTNPVYRAQIAPVFEKIRKTGIGG